MARGLTRKQKVFADALLDNPKLSATKAALRAYDTTRGTAAQIGMENLLKPTVQLYLEQHDYESQSTIVEMMNQRTDKRLAFDAAKDIQDRVHGKAMQKTTNLNVNVTIEDILNSLD